jgi:hypothetical protein
MTGVASPPINRRRKGLARGVAGNHQAAAIPKRRKSPMAPLTEEVMGSLLRQVKTNPFARPPRPVVPHFSATPNWATALLKHETSIHVGCDPPPALQEELSASAQGSQSVPVSERKTFVTAPKRGLAVARPHAPGSAARLRPLTATAESISFEVSMAPPGPPAAQKRG